MKNFLFAVGFLLVSSLGFSQEEVPSFDKQNTATIDANYCVTLDSSSPVAEYYVIDISALSLENEGEAWKQFGYRADNLLTYHVFYADQKVTLQLHLDRTVNPEDINWWNAYLTNKCDK